MIAAGTTIDQLTIQSLKQARCVLDSARLVILQVSGCAQEKDENYCTDR